MDIVIIGIVAHKKALKQSNVRFRIRLAGMKRVTSNGMHFMKRQNIY